MSNDKSMDPMSGETVETDGVYADEDGHEAILKRGDTSRPTSFWVKQHGN